MKIVFEMTDGENFRFSKAVDLPAVPQIGSECDPDGRNYRTVSQVYYHADEIAVQLELDQTDTPDNLEKWGWTRETTL